MIPTLQLGGFGRARYRPPAGGGGGDPNFANVQLLLHMDGADDGTVFTDSSSSNRTMTRLGSIVTKTAEKKFGTASVLLDGTDDGLTTTYTTAAFRWWAEDFTIEAWVNPTTLASWQRTSTIPGFIGNFNAGDLTVYWSFGPMSTGVVRFYYYASGEVGFSSTETISTSAWSHIAMTHVLGSGIKIWVNGVGTAFQSIVGSPLDDINVPFNIGRCAGVTPSGYVDDIRVTKGVARYTSNFTPPTAAFPDS